MPDSTQSGNLYVKRTIALRAALQRVMDHSAGSVWQIAAEALAEDDKVRHASIAQRKVEEHS